jgi:hypothetical protein
MKNAVRLGMCVVFAVALASAGMAAQSASHTVTVQVNAINELDLTGGNIMLTVGTATAGQEPDAATDTTCHLNWTANQANRKITVATDLPSPLFTLKVLAQSVSGGTAAPEVTLSTTAADFVTGISKTVGTCTLGYTTAATAAQGTGSDVHTVTYTLTNG